MEESNPLLRCSVESIRNLTLLMEDHDTFNPVKLSQTSKVVGFGTVACVCTTMIVSVIVSLKFGYPELINIVFSSAQDSPTRKVSPRLRCKPVVKSKNLLRTLVMLFLILITPLTVLFLLLAVAYKTVCLAIIKWNDEHFVKCLDSFDVFWSLEDDNNKSIITVLGVIQTKSPQIFASNIKIKLKIINAQGPDKIFYLKREKYGFYYWKKQNHVDLNQYVKVIHQDCSGKLNMSKDLENLMTNVESEALPYNNEGLFQILITNERLNDANAENGEYGIIFRIHHSVGDGVALIHFLYGKLADKEEYFRLSVPEVKVNNYFKDIVEKIKTLLEIPLSFVDAILRPLDENSFHGPALSGRKLFRWSHTEEDLLQKVKELKDKVKGLSFTGVLLVALARALHDVFVETRGRVPDQVSAVIPIRFPKLTTYQKSTSLENDFTVALLNLPINGGNNTVDGLMESCRCLSKSAEPLTNYYLLRTVSVLPCALLRPLLGSRHATLAFSNLRGPSSAVLGGGALLSLVFFVPLKGTTGIGVTALTYGSVLRLAVSADAALADASTLQALMKGLTAEIRRMHAEWV